MHSKLKEADKCFKLLNVKLSLYIKKSPLEGIPLHDIKMVGSNYLLKLTNAFCQPLL